jgi:hypothetical protein
MASKKSPVYIADETADLNPGKAVHLVRGERVEADQAQIDILLENGHIHEATDEELDTLDPKVDEAHQHVVDRAAEVAANTIIADARKRGIDEEVQVDAKVSPPSEPEIPE